MPIRHAMSFSTRRPQVAVFNRTTVINQQTSCRQTGNGAFWGGFLGGLFSGVGNMLMNTRTVNLDGQNPYAYLNNQGQEPAKTTNKDLDILNKHFGDKYIISERDGKFIATPKGGGEPITGTFDEMLDKLSTPSKPSPRQQAALEELSETIAAQEPEGAGGLEDPNDGNKPADEYKITEIPGNKTYTVQNGNTWYGIVMAKYDIPQGVNIKDVAYALAAANSGAEGAEAMQKAKQGVYFKVGDNIQLPDKLTVNGQEISLKSDYENSAVAQQKYGFTNATNWAVTVTQVGSTWQLHKNGELQGTYNSQAEAETAKQSMMQANTEE